MLTKQKSSAIKLFLTDKVGISGCFLILFVIFVFIFNSHLRQPEILNLNNYRHIRFDKDAELARIRNANCSFFDCFNVYRCGNHQNKITIYVYPLTEYSDEKRSSTFITKEFYTILKTIIGSRYYTPHPSEACLFVPSIDLLNQNLLDKSLVGKALASLDL
jgi:glucuronyl/N-acetylglucosaminyl transferase EXT2